MKMKVEKYYCDRCGKAISDVVARIRKVQIQQTEVHLCYKCSDELLDIIQKHRNLFAGKLDTIQEEE